MKTTTVFLTAQIRTIEDWARSQPESRPLMERAGLATAELAQEMAGPRARAVLVLAGPGNNGGDAFVAARHLKAAWFDVRVVFTGQAENLQSEARAAFDAWQAAGGTTVSAIPQDWRWQIALDGLFGIGLSREMDPRHAQLVAALNASGRPVIAIDIPSGLDADTGRVQGVAVRAAWTMTFLGLKAGLFTLDGPDHCGHVRLDRLGTDDAPLPDGHGLLVGDDLMAGALPPRPCSSHKGMFGDVGILGGAPGMVGAALLAGRAALRLGAGRVLVGLLADGPEVDLLQPDLMLRRAEEVLSRAGLNCAVIGPGLGQSSVARQLLAKSLELDLPLVLDADALNLIADDSQLRRALSSRAAPSFATPHPAEAARLLATGTDQVQADRVKAAIDLAKTLGAYCVLKGTGSVCAAPDARWWINTSGNPGMSSAGMGDVLAGLLGALVAQGALPDMALAAAVRLHGLAADELVAKGVGPVGLTASETIDAARAVWNRLARKDARAQDPQYRHDD
jgi:hydroxyethylthiazole kinase-like uncharacterized protein yjeF